MQLFSANAKGFSKNLEKFFDPDNINCPKKLLIIDLQVVFFQYWPGCPNGPKTEIPYSVDSIKHTVHLASHGLFFLDIQYPKSLLMQDCVFRLRFCTKVAVAAGYIEFPYVNNKIYW